MNQALREHPVDPITERRMFSLAIPTPSELPDLRELPPGHFVCLIAWDARGTTVETISALAEPLLRAGASYLVCWGPDCERVHDVIEQIASHPDDPFGIPDDSCIMTSWHDHDPLREALHFFLRFSWPDEHYFDSTRAGLAISVGSDAWANEILEALEDRGSV